MSTAAAARHAPESARAIIQYDTPCLTTFDDWRDDPQAEHATRLRDIRERHKAASRMEYSPKKDFLEGCFKPSGGYIVNHYPGDVGFLLTERDALAARVVELETKLANTKATLRTVVQVATKRPADGSGDNADAPSVDPADLGPLTERQAEVLREIIKFRDINGDSPTFRELMPLIGVASPNGAKIHIDALLKKGWLTTLSAGGSRAIVPLRGAEAALAARA